MRGPRRRPRLPRGPRLPPCRQGGWASAGPPPPGPQAGRTDRLWLAPHRKHPPALSGAPRSWGAPLPHGTPTVHSSFLRAEGSSLAQTMRQRLGGQGGPPNNLSRVGAVRPGVGDLLCPQARGLKWVLTNPVSETCKTSLGSTRFKQVRSS